MGSWSSGGNLNTARKAVAGCGTQTAGLSFGGRDTANRNTTEEYNGTSWSAGGILNTARRGLAGAGTQTAGLSFGGYTSTYASTTEEYDGSSWAAGGSLNTARFGLAGAGTQTAGLSFGGYASAASDVTEEYDGTSWAAGGDLNTARYYLAGAGTQIAGLSFGGYTSTYAATTEEYDGSSWAAGGDLNTARYYLAGAGTQTAGLSFGGYASTYASTTEEYDGAAWAAGGILNTARFGLAGAGTQTSGLSIGGRTSAYVGTTEEYNGTSWSAGGDLSTARYYLGACGADSTAGLSFGGYDGSANTNVTEEYAADVTDSATASLAYKVRSTHSTTAYLAYKVADTNAVSYALSYEVVEAGWLSGWSYRKKITVNNTGSALSDYQLCFTVNRSTGSDSGFTVYVSTNCEEDYDDIRFATTDGTTLCDYRIESSSSSTATIWVEVPSIAGSGDTTLYLYYGNAAATAVSSGEDTFPFFDDFPGSALDTTTNWDVASGSVTVTGGECTISSGKIKSKTAVTGPLILRGRIKYTNANQWKNIGWCKSGANDAHLFHAKNTGTAMVARSNNNAGIQQEAADLGNYCDNAYHTIELAAVSSSSFKYYVDGSLGATLTYDIGTSLKIQFEATTSDIIADWILIRKYAATEPTVSAWGAAEGDTTDTVTAALAYKVASAPSVTASLSYVVGTLPVDYSTTAALAYKVATTGALAYSLTYALPGDITELYACEQPVRRIHGKVEITYSSPLVDAGETITSSGEVYNTDDADTADEASGALYKWFSLQDNVLDGTYHPMPTDTVGWWSSTVSNTYAEFAANACWLQIEFADVKNVGELYWYGDDQLEGYPVDFTVKLYDDTDTLVHTETVTGHAASSWTKTLSSTLTNILKVRLDVTRINVANTSCKITEFWSSYKETYEDDDLFFISILEEMEYTGSTIPIGNISSNEITVRIDNSDGRFDIDNPDSPVGSSMTKNRKIQAWLGVETPYGGTTQWQSMGVFYSQDWRVYPDAPYVEVVGLDRLSLLANSEWYTPQIYQNWTLHDLAVLVLEDAGLNSNDYEIDPDLDTADYQIPYSWFNRCSHRYALKELAEACLGRCYCDRDGKVVLEPYQDAATSKVSITSDKYFSKNNPINWNEICNYVEVAAKPRALAASATEVYNDVEALTVPAGSTATRFCQFNTSDPVDEVATAEFTQSGADITLTGQTNYTWASSLTFTNAGGSDQTVDTITIDGKILATSGNKVATAYDQDSIDANGKQALGSPIENYFIQTKAYAQDIADAILASYKDPRRDVELDCRGYTTLYLGDRISVPTYDDAHLQDYTVIRQEIRWDGTMRVQITGRKIA